MVILGFKLDRGWIRFPGKFHIYNLSCWMQDDDYDDKSALVTHLLQRNQIIPFCIYLLLFFVGLKLIFILYHYVMLCLCALV